MMKRFIVPTAAVLIFLFILTASSSAQFSNNGYGSVYGYSTLLSETLGQADWQLDYIQLLDPAELEKGEYRFSPIVARVNYSDEVLSYPGGDLSAKDDQSTMIYGAVFDTAISDNLTIHGKYIYQPWEDYYDYEFDPSDKILDSESRMSLLDLFINYEVKEDNTLYFGYNRMLSKNKNYDNNEELEDEDEDIINLYYIGYQMRGKFTGSSD